MAIKRREMKESKGRHPLLKLGSHWYNIYSYVKGNPNCTREELREKLSLAANQVSGRVNDLLNHGLLIEPGWKISPRTHKKVRTLAISGHNETGNARSRHTVDVILYLNPFTGRFHTRTADNPIPGMPEIARKRVTFMIPKDNEPLQTSAKKSLTIDGQYEILE